MQNITEQGYSGSFHIDIVAKFPYLFDLPFNIRNKLSCFDKILHSVTKINN